MNIPIIALKIINAFLSFTNTFQIDVLPYHIDNTLIICLINGILCAYDSTAVIIHNINIDDFICKFCIYEFLISCATLDLWVSVAGIALPLEALDDLIKSSKASQARFRLEWNTPK